MYEEEHQSIFVFKNPLRFLSRKGRQIGAYLAGGLVNELKKEDERYIDIRLV